MSGFSCFACDLHKTKGNFYVTGKGPDPDPRTAKVLFVAEAPSEADQKNGYPLWGQFTRPIFNEMLQAAGLKREEVFVTNLVMCRPPMDKRGNVEKPSEEHIEACWKNLDYEISYVKPKFIVALGATPAKVLLHAKTLSSSQWKFFDSADCRGFTFSSSGETKEVKHKIKGVDTMIVEGKNKPGEFVVMATNSPGGIARDPSKKAETLRAMTSLGDRIAGRAVAKADYDYKYAFNEEEVYKLLQEVHARTASETRMVFDIETSGFYWFKRKYNPYQSVTLSCAFSFKPYQAYGVVLRPAVRSARVVTMLRAILESPIKKGGHVGKFDNIFVRGEMGIQVKNFVFDTALAAYALDQESNIGLDTLSPIYRPDLERYWESMKQYLDSETGYLNAPDPELLEYNCRDVDVTFSLWDSFPEQMFQRGKTELFETVLMPHQTELEDTEYVGVQVDVEATERLGRTMLSQAIEMQHRALGMIGRHPHWWGEEEAKAHGLTKEQLRPFNLNSGQQLAKLLYEELRLPITVYTKKTKKPSTDADALENIKNQHPFVQELLTYRKTYKLLSTYIGWERRPDGTEGVNQEGTSILASVDEHGRLHTNFKVFGTETGRLSSSNPNLQNQPKTKAFRDLFVAKEGYSFVDSDFSGLELRILASVSNDEGMIDSFNRGIDPHAATAAEMFKMPLETFQGVDVTLPDGKEVTELTLSMKEARKKYPDATKFFDRKDRKERKVGKIINFGVAYGKGAKSLAEELHIVTDEAERYLKDWAKARPGASAWIEGQHQYVRQHAAVRYSLNRERPLYGIRSDSEFIQSEALRQSVNTPIQGTGADCTSIAFIRVGQRVRKELGPDIARIVLEVHDQIITEVRNGYEDKVETIVREEMTRPMPMLRANLGLDVDCVVKKRWGDGLKE
jgi:DNA polymerase-1